MHYSDICAWKQGFCFCGEWFWKLGLVNNKSNLYSAIWRKWYPHSAVHSHNVHTDAICAHMNIHEAIIVMHIYMSKHIPIHRHMYKYIYIYTNIQTRLPILIVGGWPVQPLWLKSRMFKVSICITYKQIQSVHIWTYMKQSYSYTYPRLHINTYTDICTNIYQERMRSWRCEGEGMLLKEIHTPGSTFPAFGHGKVSPWMLSIFSDFLQSPLVGLVSVMLWLCGLTEGGFTTQVFTFFFSQCVWDLCFWLLETNCVVLFVFWWLIFLSGINLWLILPWDS